MRVALGIEYDGSGFVGWQRQRSGRSIQANVEDALSRVANSPITVQCAGRTDAGVHACGQVVHFDSPVNRPDRAWVMGTNSMLPPDVSVLWARPVADEFHARFSALARAYRYVICNRPARAGLWSGKVSCVHGELDACAMHEAAQCLVGEHDFSSFRAAGCQARHPVREITVVNVSRSGEFAVVEVAANAFLQHMVRNIVGTLVPVGRGLESRDWVARVLAARDRTVAGVTAAPDGLYLESVRYPSRFDLPQPAQRFGPWSPV